MKPSTVAFWSGLGLWAFIMLGPLFALNNADEVCHFLFDDYGLVMVIVGGLVVAVLMSAIAYHFSNECWDDRMSESEKRPYG